MGVLGCIAKSLGQVVRDEHLWQSGEGSGLPNANGARRPPGFWPLTILLFGVRRMVRPIHHQVVVYASDPHTLARFWASAMGYVLQDNEGLINQVMAAGLAQESDVVVFDGRRYW
jgi:hypothetical protein